MYTFPCEYQPLDGDDNECTISLNIFRSSILEEVQNQGNTKLPSNKNVLVLGDNETGKTTLVAKLQGVEDPKKGSALEYAYIDVRDEYRDGKCVFLLLNIVFWYINKCLVTKYLI